MKYKIVPKSVQSCILTLQNDTYIHYYTTIFTFPIGSAEL